jgi:hypothetical protein
VNVTDYTKEVPKVRATQKLLGRVKALSLVA